MDLRDLPLGPTDQYYREFVPKGMAANLAFRRRCLEMGYDGHAEDLWIVCSRDILFAINVFGWTLDPRKHPRQPVRPFITYPFQDRAILELQGAIGKEDVAIPKTRDMGASWICLLVLWHYWQFVPHQLFLLSSRKEDLVDGDERSLFAKLDWFIDRLPVFLKPQISRTRMHLTNIDNGSRIDGEATVEQLGTGDRRTAIMLDETSKMPHADKIFTSTRDVTECRIFNSTPNGRHGAGKAFYERVKNPATKKIFLHWSEHPLKNKGLYKKVAGRRKPLNPDTYRWQKDYDFKQLTFTGRPPRSEWYDNECRREGFDPDEERGNKLTIAQELDIDFQGSSERFADQHILSYCREHHVIPPVAEGRLGVDDDDMSAIWMSHPHGPFKLWCPFDGRRPPLSEYSVGVDVSAGTGGSMTSNSAIVVFDKVSCRLVARFAVNTMKPEPFARYAIGVCKWFYDAFMVPEVNGSTGITFINTIMEAGYWNVYLRDTNMLGWGKKSRKMGYTNPDRGTAILGKLQDAMGRREAIVTDELVIEELNEYEWASDGKIKHSGSIQSTLGSDTGLTHGDIAIATACAWLGVGDSPPETEGVLVEGETLPPHDCMAKRFQVEEEDSSRPEPVYDW